MQLNDKDPKLDTEMFEDAFAKVDKPAAETTADKKKKVYGNVVRLSFCWLMVCAVSET